MLILAPGPLAHLTGRRSVVNQNLVNFDIWKPSQKIPHRRIPFSFFDKNQVEDEERERVGARRSPSPGMQVHLVVVVVVVVGRGGG